jgi:hypothetical protein
MAAGYRYASVDNSQSFYLYQNHLFNYIAQEISGDFIELTSDERDLTGFGEVAPGTAIHIPWWKFYVPEPVFNLPLDAIASNHTLTEMQTYSLRYAARLSNQLLQNKPARNKDDLRCLFVEGWGWGQAAGNVSAHANEFLKAAGFSHCGNDP